MFNPFKQKNEPVIKCVLENSNYAYAIDGITFFQELEDNSSTSFINLESNYSLDQYINPLIMAVKLIAKPSQQSSPQQFYFNQQSSTHTTPTPVTDPQKEQQLMSEALNTIKSYVCTWSLKSLRKVYLKDLNAADRLLKELRKCFETQHINIEQQIIILYITHKFAIATCAPQIVMETLTYGTFMLTEKNTSPATPILLELIPSSIIKTKLHKRNIGDIITKILKITIKICEKNSVIKLTDNYKGKLLMFEETPFLITKDLKRLFETMRRFVMNKNNGSSGMKEKVAKAATKYLYLVLDRNLNNMNWQKLAEANDQLQSYTTSVGIPSEMADTLTIQFLTEREEPVYLHRLRELFLFKSEKEEEIKRSISTALHYFMRIMNACHRLLDLSAHLDAFMHSHSVGRFNFIKDFFILSIELIQNLCSKGSSLYYRVTNDDDYVLCLTLIHNSLQYHRGRNDVESDSWVEMENSIRSYMEKVSVSGPSFNIMRDIQVSVAFGLLNSSIRLPDDWKNRPMSLHLGKMRKNIQDVESTSEFFERMSISECSDSKESFCSNSQEDPSTMFSRIFPDEVRSIDDIEDIYSEIFHHNYYKEEKYPWIENLSLDLGKRQIILFTLCSVLKVIYLHCGPTLNIDTLRRIHQEVENTISFKRNTNDYNSVSPKDLKYLLRDVLLHTDQLTQVSTLNEYYKTIEEGHPIEFYSTEKDLFEAIFYKRNYFTEMFRLTSLANAFSRDLDFLLDNMVSIHPNDFFGFPHPERSLIFNLESCGVEVFQSIVIKLLSIQIKFAQTEKILQVMDRLNSPYYRNIVVRCVMEAAVRIYFGSIIEDSTTDIFRKGLENIPIYLREQFLGFYIAILKKYLSGNMSKSLISHSIQTFKSYITKGGGIPFDSRMILLTCPDIFTSRECAEVIANSVDIMQLLTHNRLDESIDSFLFYMFRSSIVKLAFDHSITNSDILNNANYTNLFGNIVRMGMDAPSRNDVSVFKLMHTCLSNSFNSVLINQEKPNWNEIVQFTDSMLIYLARYWILQKQPDILITKQLREYTLNLEEVVVSKAEYYKKDVLGPHLESIVLELSSDLSSDTDLLLKPTLWLIGAVEALTENPITKESSTLFFNLFQACIFRLTKNNTFVEIMVLICKLLIKRSHIWESYLLQNIAQSSTLESNLKKMQFYLENSIFKNTSITLHKCCLDLFQLVCLAVKKFPLDVAIGQLDRLWDSSQTTLYEGSSESKFFRSFNTLIQALKSYSSNPVFPQTYSNVDSVHRDIAFRVLNTASMIPICKYIRLLLQSPIAGQLLRNTNFSLFYCANSNSKLLLTSCIKNSIKTETKKTALIRELNIFTNAKQEISNVTGTIFLSKPSVTKKIIPIDYLLLKSNPIDVLKQTINNMNMVYTLNSDGYDSMLDIKGLYDGIDSQRIPGIANIIVFNTVCKDLKEKLSQPADQVSINSYYFVLGCLLGSSILCKYYLGPLDQLIDQEILQSFLDSTPVSNEKLDCANNFVTGLRIVLGDDLANFLKIFNVSEFISIVGGDSKTISSSVIELLHQRVDRDHEISESDSTKFLELFEECLKEDVFFSTLLLNYMDALLTGMEGRTAFSLTLAPSRFYQFQINRSTKTIVVPICKTKEELKALISGKVEIIL